MSSGNEVDARAASLTHDDIRAFIEAATWNFARTVPEHPHWYTVRGQTDELAFEAVVLYIREHGYRAEFAGHAYVYFDIDGYAYWTMGAPLEETIILNRRGL